MALAAHSNHNSRTRPKPLYQNWDNIPTDKKLSTLDDVEEYLTSVRGLKYKGKEDKILSDVGRHREWWVEDVYMAFRSVEYMQDEPGTLAYIHFTDWACRKYTAQHLVAVSRLIVSHVIRGCKRGFRAPTSPSVLKEMESCLPVEMITCLKRLKTLIEVLERNKTVAADLLEWYDSDIVLNDVLVHPQAYSQAWSTAHKGRKTRNGSIHSVYLEFGYLTPLEKLEADGAMAGYFSNHQMREDVNMDDPTVKTIRNQKLAWVAEIYNSIIDVRNLQDDGRSLFSQRFIARPGLLVNPCYDEKRIQVAAHMIMNTVLESAANGFIRPRHGSNQGRFFSNMTLAERLEAICYTLRRSKRAFDHVHAKGHPKAIELIYQPDAYLQHGKALEDTPTEYAVNQNTAADELGGQLTDERHGGTATANSTNSSAHAQRMPVQEGGKRASRKDKNAAAQQDVREAADRPAKRGKKRKRAEASAPQVNTGSTPDDARPQPAASSSAYPPSVQHLINIGYSFRWTRNEGNYAVTTEFPSRKTTRERIYETITAELPEGYEEAEAEEEESIPSTSSPLSSLRGSTPELSDTEPVHRESAALPKLSFSGSLGALEAPGAELIDHQEGGEEHGDVEPSASSSPLSSLKSPTPELSDDDAFYGTSKRVSQRAASAGTRHATDATRRKDERLRIWKTIPSLDQQEPSEEDQHRTPLSRIRDILNPRTLEQKHSSWKSPK